MKKHFLKALVLTLSLSTLIIALAACHQTPHTPEECEQHNLGEWKTVVQASCKDGQRKRSCYNCPYELVESIPANGKHSFGPWEQTIAPSCADGEEKKECSVCGVTETRSIDSIRSHEWGEWTTTLEAVCVTDGKKTRTCAGCNTTQNQTISKTGIHVYDDWETTKAATCGAPGLEKRGCKNCTSYEQRILNSTEEHNFASGVCTSCSTDYFTLGLMYTISDDGLSYSVSGMGNATDNHIVIPSTYKDLPVISIDDRAFYNYQTQITQVTIPDNIISIGQHAFENCYSLRRVNISDTSSMESICGGAFKYCSALNSINIPSSVCEVGALAFFGCQNIVESIGGVDYVGNWVVDSSDTVTTAEIRNGTVGIAGSSFLNGAYLNRVIMPDTVKYINGMAFEYCTSLYSINISTALVSIGGSAFRNCRLITNLSLPEGLTKIEKQAFSGCKELTSITIPSTVNYIGQQAFDACPKLSSVTFTNASGWAYSDPGSAYYMGIPADSLSNAATAATYLKSTYTAYNWRRSE